MTRYLRQEDKHRGFSICEFIFGQVVEIGAAANSPHKKCGESGLFSATGYYSIYLALSKSQGITQKIILLAFYLHFKKPKPLIRYGSPIPRFLATGRQHL